MSEDTFEELATFTNNVLKDVIKIEIVIIIMGILFAVMEWAVIAAVITYKVII
ncbi:MAG: hypothetical protein PHD20_04740 [Clostridia bacterium]|nr:hypothetical protein [Clostridia bacterium]MDD4720685.1 hypothetical protein [Bacteroides sp.]